MGIQTKAGIQNGYYGKWEYNPNAYNYQFKEFGKAVTIEEIRESIETGEISLALSFDYQGKKKGCTVLREQTADRNFAQTIAKYGADVTPNTLSILVDTLRLQEEMMQANGIGVEPTYQNLGWIQLPDGGNSGFDLCYRANQLLGPQSAKYAGNFEVRPQGDFHSWRQMVEQDVIGHKVLELVLIASLAAVVHGLIAPYTNAGNPIVHLNYSSGKGKSTAAYLAASTAGKPFDGAVTVRSKLGTIERKQNLYQSWGASDTALITSLAGNCGVVTVLNELGKNLSKNMTRLIFEFSEGTDKRRSNPKLESLVSESYVTVFISTGESSLLDKCKSKLEGLQVRVMEIDQPITDSAEHANRIKKVCTEHCGHAVPMLAQYIIDNGGVDFILPRYEAWVERLQQELPSTAGMERFVEKFAALFMATADIATDALHINFDKDGLLQFLKEYDIKHGAKRNTSAGSFEAILAVCRLNKDIHFYRKNGKGMAGGPANQIVSTPRQECWGRITNVNYFLPDGRNVVEEFEVRPSIVEKILADKFYENIKTCVDAWTANGVIDRDKDRPTRSRKIDPTSNKSEDVYVFLVFADTNLPSEDDKLEESAKPRSGPPRTKITALLGEDEDDE